jgi:NADH:ubiquinone oxidoreductase subunit E
MQTEIITELKMIREKKGELSPDDLRKIGKKYDKNLAEVFSVATFYIETSPSKRGKYRINLCRSLPCRMKEMERIFEYLVDELQIEPEGVTEDGLFSLHLVNCIGACDKAPAMLINEDLYGDLTAQKVHRIITDLRNSKDK